MNSDTTITASSLYERALGAYLGFACGDALGATLEFMTPEQIHETYGLHKDITGGGWLGLPQGHVTDATEMTLTLSQAIIDAQGWDIKVVADYFVVWLSRHPTDISEAVLRGIRRYKNTGDLMAPYDDHDAGNGACSRILPLALICLYQDEAFESWLCEQNHFTHHNSLSDRASQMLGYLVKHLIRQETDLAEEKIAEFIEKEPQFAFSPYPGHSSGYIVDTIQTVLHFFHTTDSLEDCITKTVNMGGDANTVGALAGMLAGAKYGVGAIPERWLKQLDPDISELIKQQTTTLLSLAEKLTEQNP
ncbi:ADP-ribosyl-[dinitrogen reductase] hydrolase [Methylophaga sp.]|uniref:ADP-ribosyl-[dinitrogen reductase] hydrolase n=1 Tax=Methylophaga sp. TaxID=2024840 RepID=UPI003A94AEA1